MGQLLEVCILVWLTFATVVSMKGLVREYGSCVWSLRWENVMDVELGTDG